MKNFKKTILSFLIIFALLSNVAVAVDLNFNKDNYLDYFFKYFPKTFYDDLYILNVLEENSKLSKDIVELSNFRNEFISRSKADIKRYIYHQNLDNFPEQEQFFSADNINKNNGFRIPYENSNQFMSNYYNKNYLKVYLKEDILSVEGINTWSQTWSIVFYDDKGNEINPSYLTTMPIDNNRFKKDLKLSNLDGLKSVTISLNTHKLNKYYPSDYNFYFTEEKNRKSFIEPITLKANKEIHLSGYKLNPDDFLSLEHIDKSEREILNKKAREITKGIDSDYEKVLAIHNWVSKTISYDFDSIKYNDRGPNDAFGTFTNKKAVCQGYAELTLALCRSVNIPTKLIYGYALGVVSGEESWNDTSLNEDSNHAWNEAFVDGRWIIVDTTWDSSNRYEEKKFKKDEIKLRYFDPSLKAFSETHRILSIVDI